MYLNGKCKKNQAPTVGMTIKEIKDLPIIGVEAAQLAAGESGESFYI